MDFNWVVRRGDVSDDAEEVAFWDEQEEIDQWIEAGSPPVEEWRGTAPKAPAPKVKPEKGDVVLRAYTREQAAEALGMSVDSFDRHVMGEIRSMQVGRLVRIPVAELDRYIEKKARRAL